MDEAESEGDTSRLEDLARKKAVPCMSKAFLKWCIVCRWGSLQRDTVHRCFLNLRYISTPTL